MRWIDKHSGYNLYIKSSLIFHFQIFTDKAATAPSTAANPEAAKRHDSGVWGVWRGCRDLCRNYGHVAAILTFVTAVILFIVYVALGGLEL